MFIIYIFIIHAYIQHIKLDIITMDLVYHYDIFNNIYYIMAYYGIL